MSPESVRCACTAVACQGQPQAGETLCAVCQELCTEPQVTHISSGKVREMFVITEADF